jgi:hypothetical protein
LRNQAMKKLFSNPHYQFAQMDKLDIYIDDYSQPDPIPMEMLRQMNQAKALFLFEDDEDEEKDASQVVDPRADPLLVRKPDAEPIPLTVNNPDTNVGSGAPPIAKKPT